MSNETTTKKPRVKKTLAERRQELAQKQRNLDIEAAREILSEIPGFRQINDALVLHKKFAFEGKGLADDAKFAERRASLVTRLANLDKKRAIATVDVSRRENAIERFENLKAQIGAKISEVVDGGSEMSQDEIVDMVNAAISDDDRAFLLDTTDPYSAFRRAPRANDEVDADFPGDESQQD